MTGDDVKLVSLDGALTWKVRCPRCHAWGEVDDDQFHGRVSMICDCGWHEAVDVSDMLDKAT